MAKTTMENSATSIHSGHAIFKINPRAETLTSSSETHQSNNNYSPEVQKHMSERCTRNGEARYAVKYLMLADATKAERIQARVDLAIEVDFLHVLSHPHIIKMRALFKSDTPFHPDYFFVMDRLYGTLEDKTKEWVIAMRECKSHRPVWLWPFHPCSHTETNEEMSNLLIERLLIAHDIASVLGYMHATRSYISVSSLVSELHYRRWTCPFSP